MSKKTSYSKLFIPPRFLERPAVCLELRPQGIYFLSLKNTEKGLLPNSYGLIPLPEGSVAHGEILKKDAVTKALVDIKEKTKMSYVKFSVPEEKTYFFKIRLPELSNREIRDILEFKIEENVPLSAKEAVFDYDIIPGSSRAGQIDLVVSVTPLKFIEDWQAAFESAGLNAIMFSPEADNIAKAVVKKNNKQIMVIVNFKEDNIILSLVEKRVVCQTSSIDFGSATFISPIANFFNVSPEEAQKIKHEKLFVEDVRSLEIFSSLINTVSAIKDEIYKFIAYCNAREDVDGQVEKVVLCGRDSMIVGFDQYLLTNLNLNVEVGNVWTNNFDLVEYLPEISRVDSLDLAAVNGLGLTS